MKTFVNARTLLRVNPKDTSIFSPNPGLIEKLSNRETKKLFCLIFGGLTILVLACMSLTLIFRPETAEFIKTSLVIEEPFAENKAAPEVFITAHQLEGFREAFIPAMRFHIVQQGDTLSSISKQYYGTIKRWEEIYEANRGQIPNQNSIRPGLKLLIP